MEIELPRLTVLTKRKAALSKYFTKEIYSMICQTGKPIKLLNKNDIMY